MKNTSPSPAPGFIPFSRPSLGAEEEAAVLEVLRSGWLTTGKVAARFEKEFADYCGARFALAVSSATAGLHLGLEALGVGPGRFVVTSPYTFTATAEVVRYLGADPLFVDVEEGSGNLDPGGLERCLADHAGEVAAVIPVHVAGLPCRMGEILKLAASQGAAVVEDASHAFPVRQGGRMVGCLGACGVYSFYATKPITTGEGGMVVTDREDLAQRIRIMRLHGIDRPIWDRYCSPAASWYYQVVEAGFKYNMGDLAAALGVEQLKKAREFWEERLRIAARYREGLAGLDFLLLPPEAPAGSEHAWHLFMIRLREERLIIRRDRFIEEMLSRGIGVSVHYLPLHQMPYYRDRYRLRDEQFPAATRLSGQVVSLPIYPGLKDKEVERVLEAVREIGERFHA